MTAPGRPPAFARDRTLLLCSVGLLVTAAWLALWLFGEAPHGSFLRHHGLAGPALTSAPVALLFVSGWMVMTVAMMLPTSLPILVIFHAIAGRRPDRPVLVGLVATGYLVTWMLFGAVVYLGSVALLRLVHATPWLGDRPWAIGAAVLVLAGAYQFTPLKYRCLDKCRSPLSFVIEHWRGRHARWHAFRLGVHHGVFCVGCCWALMLLMFVVGTGNLAWMFILGAVMAVEKNLPWGRRLSAPLGVALLASGMAVLVLA